MGLLEDQLAKGLWEFTALDAFRNEQIMEMLHMHLLETKNPLCWSKPSSRSMHEGSFVLLYNWKSTDLKLQNPAQRHKHCYFSFSRDQYWGIDPLPFSLSHHHYHHP